MYLNSIHVGLIRLPAKYVVYILDFLLKHENQDRKSFVWPKLDINVG